MAGLLPLVVASLGLELKPAIPFIMATVLHNIHSFNKAERHHPNMGKMTT
jgi:hypothetical protein